MLDTIPGGARTLALLLTFAGAACAGLIAVPILRRLKIGQTVRDDGPATHLKKTGTPTMGGVIFIIPAAIVLAFFALREFRLIPPILVTVGFGLVGFVDDFLKVRRKSKDGLTARQKTIGLLTFATLFSAFAAFSPSVGTFMYLPLTGLSGGITLPFWIYIPFTVFVMYSTSNAVNLTDGVDGLASSVTAIVAASFAVAATIGVRDEGSAGVFAAAFAGGCLGFLLFNAHPARVIMGDCGSLALGGAVSAAAVMMRIHWIILFFGAIYVAEALSVVIQVAYFKRTGGRRIFKMSPIHHHFELSGWGEGRIVFVFCAVTVAMCLAGFGLLFGRLF